MAVNTWPEHGGEVDWAAERYGVPRDRWLDLSTGINPNPYPLPDLARDYWHRLPDLALDEWLRESAAAYYGAPDPAVVVPTPGSQAAIQWLPRLVPMTRVAIVSPTYREHAQSWTAAGHGVAPIGSIDDVPARTGVIVAVNPNNPDGRVIDPRRLLELSRDHLVVVDEAFADVAPDISLARRTGSNDLVVLRSVGKFFGLAGMRLGFVLTGQPLAAKLRRAMGHWAVSGPAAAVGAVALADDAWVRAARIRLTMAAGRLDGVLVRSGLKVLGGTTLFRLGCHPQARHLFEHLAHAGILVRAFTDRPDWLRFGIPGDDAGFDRLGTVLGSWRPANVLAMQRAAGNGDGNGHPPQLRPQKPTGT
jgi:cobalamin biosynthetic protein CobC